MLRQIDTKVAWALLKLAVEFDLFAILQMYSVSGDGKGVQDGSSGDGAAAVRDMQYKMETVANNAWDIFTAIDEKMGQPSVPTDALSRRPHGFTHRIHWFMVDTKDATPEMHARKLSAGDVIITNKA